MRVVIDTNVWVAALRSPHGASFLILKQLSRFTPLVSVPLFLEYEDVLKRPSTLKATGLSVEDMDVVLNMLARESDQVMINFLWRPQLNDPKDDMVLEVAMNGQAHAIITHNTRDFRNCDMPIWTPKEFVEKLK